MNKEYDVIVAGLGTAGSIALITASKLGLKVLGVEALNTMGGTGTIGGVSGYYFGSRGGAYESINNKANDLCKTTGINMYGQDRGIKAHLLEETARKYGADILFNSRIVEVIKNEKAVTGAVVFTKGKQIEFKSRMIIDCTGEAQVCYMAGCSCTMGRDFDGQTQPYSNMAIYYENDFTGGLNKDSGYVDPNDCGDYTTKVIDSTALLLKIAENNRKSIKYITNSPLLGVRQGRTIVGEETVTFKDFINQKETQKPVFYAYSNVDNHEKDTAFEDDSLVDWYTGAGLWAIYFSVGVPMGALIPKGYKGIITAGRCMAIEHNILSCVRMKSDMEKCGEAAAVMVYLALKDNVDVRDVDYTVLAGMLKETHCLDENNNVGLTKKNDEGQIAPFNWLTDTDEIINQLKTDKPGVAIWSAKIMGSAVVSELKTYLESDDLLLKKNAAIALALMGDDSACPVLREMVLSRDMYIPETSEKYAQMYGITAVYLLGRLGDRAIVPTLLDIIQNDCPIDEAGFTPDEFYSNIGDVKFQYISYALTALKKIGDKHPDLKEQIKKAVSDKILQDDYKIYVSLKQNSFVKHDMTDKLKAYVKNYF